MSASTKALAMPEIVGIIMAEIVGIIMAEIGKDVFGVQALLLPLLTVNKLWSHEAARVLWGFQCPEAALLNIPIDRRQHYADFVTSLSIDHAVLKHLMTKPVERSEQRQVSANNSIRYPKLTNVGLADINPRIIKEEIEQYFVPTLKDLMLYSGSIRKDILDLVLNGCPNLLKVYMRLYSVKSDHLGSKEDMLHFIANCTAIDLEICGEFDENMQILCAAANSGRYERLFIEYIDDTAIQTVKTQHNHPFEKLEYFGCYNAKLVKESLLAITPNLKTLVLFSLPNLVPLIQQLAEHQCPLEEIKLVALHGTLDKNILIKLAERHRSLKSLDLTVTVKTEVNLFDDTSLQAFVGLLPSLQLLRLRVNHCLTKNSVISIGRACPSLILLDLKPEFRYQGVDALRLCDDDLAQFTQPLFANLTMVAPKEILEELSGDVAASQFPKTGVGKPKDFVTCIVTH